MEIRYLTVGPIETNCYILCDEKNKICAVIDPGAEARYIIRAVESAGCTPEKILLTHGHYDHTGGIEDLRGRWPDLKVYLHRADREAGDIMPSIFPPVPDTEDYGEGDNIFIGDLTVNVLDTPGHSKGSVILRCENALFTGDTLFAGDCGRTDLYGGDMNEMLASLKRIGGLDGDFLVLPGHGETSNLDHEKLNNPWLRQALRLYF